MEIKAKGGRLTPDELAWHQQHPGAAVIVYSAEDALLAVGAKEAESQTAGKQ